MSKVNSLSRLTLLLLACVACLSNYGKASAEDPKPAAPKVVKSANDPTKPVPGGVRWFMRDHGKYLAQTKSKKIDLCFLGDSITAMWPGDLFNKNFGKYQVVNFGVGGDRAENVLWRLENGELKGTSPKVIVLMIGTNNMGFNTAEEVALGVTTVVKNLQTKFPTTKILLLGILPKKDAKVEKVAAANEIIAKLDDGKMVRYLDFGPKLLDKDGKIQAGMLADAVHLTHKGYEIWVEAMNPLLTEMMAQK